MRYCYCGEGARLLSRSISATRAFGIAVRDLSKTIGAEQFGDMLRSATSACAASERARHVLTEHRNKHGCTRALGHTASRRAEGAPSSLRPCAENRSRELRSRA